MNKRWSFTILLLIFTLTACNADSKLSIKTKATGITLTTFPGFGQTNGELLTNITDEKDIQTILNLLNGAKAIKGDVDMPKGDYNLLIQMENDTTEAYHLWLSNDYTTGTVSIVTDTATAYTLTKNATKKLRAILLGS